MTQLKSMTVEMHESRNMVRHLKNKLNVDSKSPVEIASAIGCTRVSHTLQKRLTKFMDDHPELMEYTLYSRLYLRDMNSALMNLNKKYTENDEANLSNQQKDYLVERVLGIEKAIMNIAGRLHMEMDAKGELSQLTAEQREFSEEAKEVYKKVQIEDELENAKFEKSEMLEAQGKEVDLSDLEDEDDGFVLGSSKPQETGSTPKQVISPDIEGL